MEFDHLTDDDYERLARYVSGEAKGEERARIARWIHADGAVKEALASMEEAWATSSDPTHVDVNTAWTGVAARLGEIAAEPAPQQEDVVEIATVRPWWRNSARMMQIAATATIVVGAAVLWPVVSSRMGDSPTAVLATAAVHATSAGERRSVSLPDGSLVLLGAASILTVAEGYGEGAREVSLTGQAFFTVTHDEERPFRVRVGEALVEDLGTEFDVRAYEGEDAVRVAVASGVVAVRRSATTLGRSEADAVLQPRDVATISSGGEVTLQRNVDVSLFTAWTTGRLVFTDAPFRDVAAELGRWYGVEVRVSDPALLARHLTATFEAESLDEVLRVIGLTLDVQWTRDGGAVDFTGPAGGSGAARGAGMRTRIPPGPVRYEAGA